MHACKREVIVRTSTRVTFFLTKTVTTSANYLYKYNCSSTTAARAACIPIKLAR